MSQENICGQENLFLGLCAGGIVYVLPLPDVGQIVSKAPGDMPQIHLPGQKKHGGTVIFQDDLGLAALTAERLIGIVQLPPECQFEMPGEARSPRGRWIAGVAFWKSEECLCYLLDCRHLRTRFLQEQI